MGNTPTGVGKTSRGSCCTLNIRKHPHGRGEDFLGLWPSESKSETPPRAWGRRVSFNARDKKWGNTPTGVGKTPLGFQLADANQKHPHGRGEDISPPETHTITVETPPRAWGRPNAASEKVDELGNTPTGVGKTIYGLLHTLIIKKHPHGRGEDGYIQARLAPSLETPPRAWGRLTL